MSLRIYGLLIALGVLAAVIYMSRESKRLSLPADLAVDVALWAVPPAVVFARLYYVAFTWDYYRAHPLAILRFWEGGLAIYGGVLGGALGVFLLSRRRKLSFALLADLVAPGLLLAQAIGRWGNFFNREAYGLAVTNPAWQFFPVAVFADGQWHLATFLYESLWNLAGFFFLLRMRGHCARKGKGTLFLWYLIWYGLGRMVIEGLRTDSLMLGNLRVSQGLSALLVAGAGSYLLVRFAAALTVRMLLPLGLMMLLAAAAGQTWALIPGFILMALFVFSLAMVFIKPHKEDG